MPRVVDNRHLPPHIESGSAIGPRFSTDIVTLQSGQEEPNENWDQALVEIDASYGLMQDFDPDDAENSYKAILKFFNGQKGRSRAFLFRDPTDFEAVDEPLYHVPGPDDNIMQLSKTYSENYKRRITRPVLSTIVLYSNGLEISNGFVIGELGQITFAGGVPDFLTASFEFDIPVRFADDVLQANIQHIRAGSVPDVNLIQIRE